MDAHKLNIELIEGIEEVFSIDEHLYDPFINDQISYALNKQGGYC